MAMLFSSCYSSRFSSSPLVPRMFPPLLFLILLLCVPSARSVCFVASLPPLLSMFFPFAPFVSSQLLRDSKTVWSHAKNLVLFSAPLLILSSWSSSFSFFPFFLTPSVDHSLRDSKTFWSHAKFTPSPLHFLCSFSSGERPAHQRAPENDRGLPQPPVLLLLILLILLLL